MSALIEERDMLQDIQDCKEFVLRYGSRSYRRIPREMRTRELNLWFASKGGLAYMPIRDVDREICEVAVRFSPYAIKYVPEKFRDEDILKLAFSEHGEAAVPCMPKEVVVEALSAWFSRPTEDEYEGPRL